MEIKKVKQLAMIGSGIFAFSQLLLLVRIVPYIIPRILAIAGAVLIFLFFYTLFEAEQKKQDNNY